MNYEEESDLIICVRCGYANEPRASRCHQCHAPLDDFAATSPWEMGTATSTAYPEIVSPKTKPIIFWGAWLYFGPSAIGSIYMGYVYLTDYLQRDKDGSFLDGHWLMLLATITYGSLSIWALWAVTKGYLGKKPEQD